MNWIDEFPLPMLTMAAVMLGLAPFYPEPHLLEKLRMLAQGVLHRPIDVFDLFLHGAPAVILSIRLWRDYRRGRG